MRMYCDLWPKSFKIEYVVDRSTARDFTVFRNMIVMCHWTSFKHQVFLVSGALHLGTEFVGLFSSCSLPKVSTFFFE